MVGVQPPGPLVPLVPLLPLLVSPKLLLLLLSLVSPKLSPKSSSLAAWLRCVVQRHAQQLAAGLQSALAQLQAGGLATVYGDSDRASVEAVLTARVEADFEALTKQAAAWLAALPYRSMSDARSAADEALDRLPDEARTIRLVKGEQGARIKAELELLREQPL